MQIRKLLTDHKILPKRMYYFSSVKWKSSIKMKNQLCKAIKRRWYQFRIEVKDNCKTLCQCNLECFDFELKSISNCFGIWKFWDISDQTVNKLFLMSLDLMLLIKLQAGCEMIEMTSLYIFLGIRLTCLKFFYFKWIVTAILRFGKMFVASIFDISFLLRLSFILKRYCIHKPASEHHLQKYY